MTEKTWISREIGIDMGHRVTYHGSKCKNIHGHRYKIRAMVEGPLYESGEQEGMVLDFGFLKEEMMEIIDANFDHGTVLWIDDPIFRMAVDNEVFEAVLGMVRADGYAFLEGASEFFSKLVVLSCVPTVENLARHWFEKLGPRIVQRSKGRATLKCIKAWETPNCSATYFGDIDGKIREEDTVN